MHKVGATINGPGLEIYNDPMFFFLQNAGPVCFFSEKQHL
jgi:hypothetical protein